MTYKADIPKLGKGIFLVSDIAKIAELPSTKVNRWLTEFWNKKFGENYGSYSFGSSFERAVNFSTLIEFIAFAQLRENGISAQTIQKFHAHLSQTLNTKYPFAETKLLTDKKDLWYGKHNELVKWDNKEQLSLKAILEPLLLKIEFDSASIATRYFPLGKDHEIVIDPQFQFGEPTIAGTSIKAETIYQLYKSEESKEAICEEYDLTLKQVNDAITYFQNQAA